MLSLLPVLSLGLLVAPPNLHGIALPAAGERLITSPQHVSIFPEPHSFDFVHIDAATTVLLANEDGKWISDAFDAAAAALIPVALVGLLFLLFKLAKLFASAF